MRVPEDRRSPRSNVINVTVAIDIAHARARGVIDEKGFSADRAKRPHGRIHAARNMLQRLGKQSFGLGQ